jgi:hypothetical protein
MRSAADVTIVEIDGEATAYVVDTGRLVPLDGPATDVLALCDGSMDTAGIVAMMASAYGVDRADLADEIEASVALLLTESLVVQLPRPD